MTSSQQTLQTLLPILNRMAGSKGTTVAIGASTTTGKFFTIYVAATATITVVAGGGAGASTWIGEIPAGTTLVAEPAYPVTSITITAGTLACYS